MTMVTMVVSVSAMAATRVSIGAPNPYKGNDCTSLNSAGQMEELVKVQSVESDVELSTIHENSDEIKGTATWQDANEGMQSKYWQMAVPAALSGLKEQFIVLEDILAVTLSPAGSMSEQVQVMVKSSGAIAEESGMAHDDNACKGLAVWQNLAGGMTAKLGMMTQALALVGLEKKEHIAIAMRGVGGSASLSGMQKAVEGGSALPMTMLKDGHEAVMSATDGIMASLSMSHLPTNADSNYMSHAMPCEKQI